MMSVQLVGVIFLKPFFGRAGDKVGRLPMMITGFSVCAVSFFILAAIKSPYAIAPLFVVYGLGFALVTASTDALAADVAKAGAIGAAIGVLGTLMDVGQTLGPPAIGEISDRLGYSAGILALGGLMLLAAAACAAWLVHNKAAAAKK